MHFPYNLVWRLVKFRVGVFFFESHSKDGFFPPRIVCSFFIQPFSLKKWLASGGQFLRPNCYGSTNVCHSLNQIPCPCSATTCVSRDSSTQSYYRFHWEAFGVRVRMSGHSQVRGGFPMLRGLQKLIQTSRGRLDQVLSSSLMKWRTGWWIGGLIIWVDVCTFY